MRLLIDSHALIWYVDQDNLVSPPARAAVSDTNNDLLFSAGSIWEISIKVGLGKLALSLLSANGWPVRSRPRTNSLANYCPVR
jgi:PIN domain nuclease of toxin-antitoxin system